MPRRSLELRGGENRRNEKGSNPADSHEPSAHARRVQRAILVSLAREDVLRLEYIRRRWQRGQQ
jgi:hypothetical protein